MVEALLTVEGLEAGYGEVQILWGVSLAAGRGHLTAIVGANGAGKTTTLRAVAGSIAPWKGTVTFEGEDVTRLPAHAKAARGAQVRDAPRRGVQPVSPPCRTSAPARRHAVGRRAADGRDRARPDVRSG